MRIDLPRFLIFSNGAALIKAKQGGELQEFDQIQAPLAAFVFGDEGLGPAQQHRQLGLAEARLVAGRDQELAKGVIGPGMNRFSHKPRPDLL